MVKSIGTHRKISDCPLFDDCSDIDDYDDAADNMAKLLDAGISLDPKEIDKQFGLD